MGKLYSNLYRKEKGFTLVELLIVVIILAVLSGIAVPSYMAMRNRARESATENEMKNIATALELYNADNEEYPPSSTWYRDLESGGYMDNVPTEDMWGNTYRYTQTGGGAGYTLESYGINGRNGGGDDIVITDGQMTEDGAYPNR